MNSEKPDRITLDGTPVGPNTEVLHSMPIDIVPDETGWRPREHVDDAERIVLGSLMMLGQVPTENAVSVAKVRIAELLQVCPPDRFMLANHQQVAAAVEEIAGGGGLPDPVAVAAEMTRQGTIRRLPGGHLYLLKLVEQGLSPTAALLHAEKIVDEHDRYRAWQFGQRTMQRAASCWAAEDNPAEWIVEQAEKLLRRGTVEADKVQTMAEDIDDLWDDLLEPPDPYIVTGLADVDRHVVLERGDLTTLAARPSVGKSLAAATIARNVAIGQHMPVFFAALEMSRVQMVQRTMSAFARVRHERFKRSCLLDPGDIQRMEEAREKLRGVPLYSDYASSVTVPYLRQKLTWLRRHHDDIGLVVVDYLGIMRATQQHERRQLALAEMTQGLRVLADDFNTHILAVHQLNRGPEQRQDKKPQLSDLRESGDIEQDSANVLLLHAPDPEDMTRAGELDIIVAKSRHGQRDVVVPVSYQPHYQRVCNLGRELGDDL